MPYLALVGDAELELADLNAVRSALADGRISAETWITDVDQEADWESVEDKLPALFDHKAEGRST
jgi:hypothetical protein